NNSFESLFTNSPASNGYYYSVNINAGIFPLQTGDFNGDGRTDLLVNTNVLESTILSLHTTDPILVELTPNRFGFPNSYHRVFTGDFNGDGISDILTYAYANLQYGWQLHYFNGKDAWIEGYCPVTLNIDPENPQNPNRFIYTTDINGDGKSDILDIYYQYSGNQIIGTHFDMYYSKGNGFKNLETAFFPQLVPHKSHIHNFFDFNGDGKAESLIWVSPDSPLHIMAYHREEKSNLVLSFVNGHGTKTSIDYMSLTNPQVYQKSFKPLFPLTNIQPSFYVVRSIKNDIGEAHLTTQTFFLPGSAASQAGKRLVGIWQKISY
ncbi:MAG: VCBS repeat-containing protein, partial [Lentimicrobium sp.]|nr:VCBS repeat-containing protein [Lentimicrobium sp.]